MEKAKPMITDEMVEKAARAIIMALYPQRLPSWTDYKLRIDGEPYRAEARAALAAVLPDIVEQCATAIDAKVEKLKDAIGAARSDGAYDWANQAVDRGLALEDAAKQVRSLASLSFQDGKK